MPEYQPDHVQILDKAIELLRFPGSIVARYEHFATDKDDNAVGYGDPAACRFCCAGVVEHAAQLIRDPGVIVNGWSDPSAISCDEQDLIAKACRVDTTPHNDYWSGEPDLADSLLEIFQRAWYDGRDDPTLEDPDRTIVAARLIEYLQRGRDNIDRALVAA